MTTAEVFDFAEHAEYEVEVFDASTVAELDRVAADMFASAEERRAYEFAHAPKSWADCPF